MSEKTSFVLYHDMRDACDILSDEEVGKLFRAILDYSEFGTEPTFNGKLQMAFLFIRSQLDRDAEKWDKTRQKRSEAGKKSGEARAKKAAETASQSGSEQPRTKRTNVNFVQQNEQPRTKRTVNVNGNVNVNDNVDVSVDERESNARAHGTYNNVFLTEDQVADLKNRYPADYGGKIDNLSVYMKRTGKQYADHYATILLWAEQDAQGGRSDMKQTRRSSKPANSRPPSFDLKAHEEMALHGPRIPKGEDS